MSNIQRSKFEVPNFEGLKEEMLRIANTIGGVEAKKWFEESFRKGGFTDSSFDKWPESGNPFRLGKKTMYSSGSLFRGFVAKHGINKVIVENIQKYGEIHNNGGTIKVTKAMKAHFWKLYYELTGKAKRARSNKARITAKAEMCKRIALMPEGSVIKMPKRQFMGHSELMMKEMERNWLIVMNRKFGNLRAK